MTVSRGRISLLPQLSATLGAGTALLACMAVLCASVGARMPQQDDPLAAARELYAGAAYNEALGALDLLEGNAAANDRERATIDHYRALCLLALNRPADATAAIEAMVRHDPLYSPPQDDLSPRTRQAFLEVQRRVLPTIAQERYARAKTAYEEGHPQEAVAQFDGLIDILDATEAAGNAPPTIGDLRVLATGFRQLAAAAVQAAAPPAPVAGGPPASEPAAASDGRVPTGSAAQPPKQPIAVTPPVNLRQDVPPWPRDLPFPQTSVAVIEVVIGPDGRVQEARLQKAVHPRYDQLLLAAARNWTYRPALRDGQPTAFVKAVRVELAQQR
jgi:TonB family protein